MNTMLRTFAISPAALSLGVEDVVHHTLDGAVAR